MDTSLYFSTPPPPPYTIPLVRNSLNSTSIFFYIGQKQILTYYSPLPVEKSPCENFQSKNG